MTVKELIQALERSNDEACVFIQIPNEQEEAPIDYVQCDFASVNQEERVTIHGTE